MLFGKTPYHCDTDLHCVANAICNAFILRLVKDMASDLATNLPESIAAASRRSRPFSDDRPEVTDLSKLGHVGPIILEVSGYQKSSA